jgi:hypothetical protein
VIYEINMTYNSRYLDTFEVVADTELEARFAADQALSERIAISVHPMEDQPRARGSDGHNPPNVPAYGSGE